MDEITELKLRLYKALLDLKETQISDSEVNIMYELSKDPLVQRQLKK